jgi:transmembrane sensor
MDIREFSRILRRYRLGEATEAEKALVEQWYDLLDEGHDEVQSQDQDELALRMWERIEASTGIYRLKEPSGKRSKIIRLAARWSVAATILLALFIGWWFAGKSGYYGSLPQAERVLGPIEADLFSHENDSEHSELLTLSDGTRVTLFPGSSIKSSSRFTNGRRDVYLNGEAFFDVARDPSNPFFVHSGGITTRVLGTSFKIKPLDGGGRMEVAVRTGKVEVFESEGGGVRGSHPLEKAMNGVVLTPNQRVIYHQENGLFESTVVEAPLPLKADDLDGKAVHLFLFSDTPLKNVLQEMGKTYGIEIIVENENLNRCPFSGDISSQDLFEKLEIVNKALGTRYEVKGTRILIKGEGCE